MVPEGREDTQAAEAVGGSGEQVHEYVVDRVRDVTRGGKIVFDAPGGGVDTGLRRLIPVTYDVVLDQPEVKETGEDK
ncbi:MULTISPECIES: hypothetical protein [Streptosporangium]|uniref:Uncharacterized protein n=1 Tax=Streptosporangium brasiliense TaxID=47480 RepID=A0ABT9R0M0_9ACTN|nr:hypothetical protein [Streptosporangium brasiliense]MDP9862476.1 hypothetical protein [Streptosporangium brasiliense]